MPNNQPPPPPSQATSSASTTPPRRAAGSAQPTLGELIARISENISALVRGEIDLAKAKGQRMGCSPPPGCWPCSSSGWCWGP